MALSLNNDFDTAQLEMLGRKPSVLEGRRRGRLLNNLAMNDFFQFVTEALPSEPELLEQKTKALCNELETAIFHLEGGMTRAERAGPVRARAGVLLFLQRALHRRENGLFPQQRVAHGCPEHGRGPPFPRFHR